MKVRHNTKQTHIEPVRIYPNHLYRSEIFFYHHLPTNFRGVRIMGASCVLPECSTEAKKGTRVVDDVNCHFRFRMVLMLFA